MRLLRVKEAAEISGHSVYTVRYWVRHKRLPATKPGKHILIREADLRQFLSGGNNGGLDEYVKAIVAGAPTLSNDQVAQLRAALGRRGQ